MDSLCHLRFAATKLSYTFPIFETYPIALCGTTGMLIWRCVMGINVDLPPKTRVFSKWLACSDFVLVQFFLALRASSPGKLGELRQLIGVWGSFVMFCGDVWCLSTTGLTKIIQEKARCQTHGAEASSAMATWCWASQQSPCRILRAENVP